MSMAGAGTATPHHTLLFGPSVGHDKNLADRVFSRLYSAVNWVLIPAHCFAFPRAEQLEEDASLAHGDATDAKGVPNILRYINLSKSTAECLDLALFVRKDMLPEVWRERYGDAVPGLVFKTCTPGFARQQ